MTDLAFFWPYSIAIFAIFGGLASAELTRVFAQGKAPRMLGILACAVIALWVRDVAPGRLETGLSLALGWALITLSFVDLRAFRLPDLLTLPLIVLGLVAAQLLPGVGVADHAAASAIAFVALWAIAFGFRRLRGREGLGLGDAKLAAAGGAWLGLAALPSILLIASAAGIIWVLLRTLARGKKALSERIAFGVPLSLAIWLIWLYGPPTFTLANG